MKHPFISVILLLSALQACNSSQVKIVTYDLKRGDFEEKIQATGTIQAVNNLCLTAPSVYGGELTVTHLVPMGSYVKKGDTICILESSYLSTLVDNYKENVKTKQAELTKLEADNALNMSMLAAQVDKNQAQMALSQLDSIQMKFAPPVKQKLLALELQKSKVEERKLSKKLEAQKQIDSSEMRQAKSRIIQAENYLKRIEDMANSLTILALRDGMVSPAESPIMMIMSGDGSTGTIGGDIKDGSKVYSEMPIVNLPDLNEVQILVEVPENDYKRIEKDQKVRINVESAGNLVTTGMVKKKSLVGKQNQAETKIKVYEITISVDSCHLQMKPGLSAECEIMVSQARDTVVVPTLAIFERDSSKIVYVSNGEKFTPTIVETGRSNSSETIISKGLHGNETIALMEPPHNIIEKPKNKSDE